MEHLMPGRGQNGTAGLIGSVRQTTAEADMAFQPITGVVNDPAG